MKPTRVEPSRRKREKPEAAEDPVVGPDADLLSEIDELLDEIDAVLEDQAVLVRFRQRSGQ